MVRHGETASNRVGRYAGWSDEPLTETGREQSVRLGRSLSGAGVAQIRTSCIARARETAHRVGSVLNVPVIEDERLNELRMGPWEGLTDAEIAERYPAEHTIWVTRPDKLRLPGRETLFELAQRVAAASEPASSGVRELLLTHVAPIRVALLLANQRRLAEYRTIDVPNCHCFEIPALSPKDVSRLAVDPTNIGAAGSATS